MNIDVSDFFEWMEEELKKERLGNGELTEMGRGMLRIKALMEARIEEVRNGERRRDVKKKTNKVQ